MKIKLDKTELNLATNRSQGAISDRALAHIGLRANLDKLQVMVADRVLVIYSTLEAEVEAEGGVFVPARLFSDVVRQLPEGKVTLESDNQFLTIKAGKSDEFIMKLPVIADKQWKEPPELDSKNEADLPSENLFYMIEQVQFCVANESPRNYGAVGFLHKPESEKIRLVGTDGFRLSYSEIDIPLPDAFLGNGVCLSKRGLNELQRMCGEGFDTIRLSISEDQTTFFAAVPNYKIFIRLSAVKYPNYQGVLPKTNLVPVHISRPYLQSVTRRVLLAADKTRALQLCFSDSSLTLRSRTLGSSEGKESIALKDYQGGEQELAINGKFLTDVFSTISSEEVSLRFRSENDPIVLIPRSEPEDCHSMHVLVPIRES